MSVRLRRLQSDYEAMRRLAHLHPRITVEGVSGDPPDRYVLRLQVQSLRERAGEVVPAAEHRLEVVLPAGYPRDAPLCRMLTPVFHPNIAPHAVCVGDHWSAAESLDRLVQRVGEMLAFQSYNVKSPLNGQAAQWVEENLARLPLEREEFQLDLSGAPERRVPASSEQARRRPCDNCAAAPAVRLVRCAQQHALCADCLNLCEACGAALCLACGVTDCAACAPPVCANCGGTGAARGDCASGHALCPDCRESCARCGRSLCLVCGQIPCRECA